MVRYIFPANEDIARKNRGKTWEDSPSYTKEDHNKPPPDKKRHPKERDTCRECGKKLEHKRARLWGICGYCDRK